MPIEYDEKGKFYTEIISKTAIAVMIQTTGQLIKGFVHARNGERLKDELDRDELFLAVTNAQVMAPGLTVQFEAPFMAVRRAQIIWIMPQEDASRKEEES